MQVLNKYEKEELVIKMHKEGRTLREIASGVHMSFGTLPRLFEE
jgi:DNA invertase Pin-like site-specific DNA recombinase